MEPRDVTPSPCGEAERATSGRPAHPNLVDPDGQDTSGSAARRNDQRHHGGAAGRPSAVGPATVPETASADSAASVVRYQVPEPVPEFRATVPSGTVSSVVEEDFTFQNHRARLPGVLAVTGAWVCAPAGKASVFVATVAGSIGAAPE